MALSPMRICLDLTPLEMRDRFGGFARYGLALGRALLHLPDRAGIEWLALPRSSGPVVSLEDALAPEFREGPVIAPRRHRWQRLAVSGQRLRDARVDLFHSLTPVALPWRPGCPVVVTAHDVIPLTHPEPGPGFLDGVARLDDRIRQRLRHRRGNHYIAISHDTAAELERWFGIPPSRVSVVHHGIDRNAFRPSTDPARALDERRRVQDQWKLPDSWFLLVGSDHHRKNQWRAYEAWVQVAPRVRDGLVVLGRALYGRVFETMVTDAASRGLGERLRWLPDVGDADLPAFYRQATALVAPSESEGFGMTLLEAMACGCPVAASRIGAHVEVAGDAASWFDPMSVEDIARALVRLGSDAERAALRATGLERATHFTWEEAAANTLEVYRKVLGRAPALS